MEEGEKIAAGEKNIPIEPTKKCWEKSLGEKKGTEIGRTLKGRNGAGVK